MSIHTVRKNVVYRIFKPVEGTWPKGSLVTHCMKALDSAGPSGAKLRDDWLARRYPAWGLSGHYRFSYALEAAGENLFGMICLYSPNEYMAMIKEEAQEIAAEEHITLAEAMKQVEIAEREPPRGEHYLKGHAYFLAVKNHVFVVQHPSLRAGALEEYLHDLLRETGVIGVSHKFILDGVIPLSDSGNELGDVKAVEVGGVTARYIPDDQGAAPLVTDTEENRELARTKTNRGKRILDIVFGTVRADEIMKAVPTGTDLEVDIRFGYKTKNRKVDRKALADIASAARDLPEGQVRAIGKDGKATGNDIRLQTEMPFKRVRENGALLDVADARAQLLKVYSRFVEDGKIDP